MPALVVCLCGSNCLCVCVGADSKAIRNELQSTREALRSAVNRAPLVSILVHVGEEPPAVHSVSQDDGRTVRDASGPGTLDSPVGKQFVAEEIDQLAGPDPMPTGYYRSEPTSPLSTNNAVAAHDVGTVSPMEELQPFAGFRKVAIEEEDDASEDGEIVVPAKSADSTKMDETITASHAIPRVTNATAKTTTTSTVEKSSGKKSEARGSDPKRSDSSKKARTVVSVYDLEKSLLVANHNPVKLAEIFKSVKPNDSPKLMASLMEPDILFLLLDNCCFYYGGHKKNWTKAVSWLESVQRTPNFSLNFSLLTSDKKSQLCNYLTTARQEIHNCDKAVDTDKISIDTSDRIDKLLSPGMYGSS